MRVESYTSKCAIKGCTFSNGVAGNDGGGVYIYQGSYATSLDSCSFITCTSNNQDDNGTEGGGLQL